MLLLPRRQPASFMYYHHNQNISKRTLLLNMFAGREREKEREREISALRICLRCLLEEPVQLPLSIKLCSTRNFVASKGIRKITIVWPQSKWI